MTDKIIKKTKKGSYDSQTVFITEYKRKFNNEIVVRYHNFPMVEIMIHLKNFLMTQRETEMNIVFS